MRWPLPTLALALAIAGAGSLASGIYMPAKAAAAQVLLRAAWAGSEGDPLRPWPWAQTWPVARLRVPELDVDQIVLAGAEGAALAFAPGHVEGTSPPSNPGNVALAGHRDTTFAFLGELRLGDEIRLEVKPGGSRRFIVDQTSVVHESDTEVLAASETPRLTLITCYPLDATLPGGSLRYVVQASEFYETATTPRQ